MAALHLDQVYQCLVHLPCKHHLNNVNGLLIGHTQTIHKHCFFTKLFHGLADFRTAAVDQNNLHTNQPQQRNILHDLLF